MESTPTAARPLRVDVNVVLVPVIVTDGGNHPVVTLDKNNFTLSENNQRQNIEYFSTEDSAISVGLILDLSGSMSDKFDAERVAVSEFFENANAQDDYFVVSFSSRPAMLAEATQSIGTIESLLSTAKPRGNTALFGRGSHGHEPNAVRTVQAAGAADHFRRRGQLKPQYAVVHQEYVRDSDVQVFAIGLFDTAFSRSFEEFMGKKWLEEITDATGGRTVTIENISQMGAAASSISHELRSQYVLGVSAQRRGTGWAAAPNQATADEFAAGDERTARFLQD